MNIWNYLHRFEGKTIHSITQEKGQIEKEDWTTIVERLHAHGYTGELDGK